MPKPQLSREKIVGAALQMADRDGLDAVSLRGIAKTLGVHVTSLYNHIPDKEAVFAEMMNALVAEANLPVGTLSWQDWIRGCAASFRALAKKHPGAFMLFQRGSAQGEQAVVSLESAIAAFRADGFDLSATQCAIRATNVAIMGLVLDEMGRLQQPEAQTDLGGLSAEEFPHIYELMQADEETDAVDYLLDALIAGIAANRTRA